jgi:hypothetical protein
MASSPTRLRFIDTLSRCPSHKATLTTLSEARDWAEALMDMGRVKPGCHLVAYECDVCGWYHVGNRKIVFKDVEE